MSDGRIARFLRLCLDFLYVPKCVSCKEPLARNEHTLCVKCAEKYEEAKQVVCGRCFQPRCRCVCSYRLPESERLNRLIKLYSYRPKQPDLPESRLIFSLKHDHLESVIGFLADELTTAIAAAIDRPSDLILVHAPRSNAAICRVGYDHTKLLAKAIADRLSLPFIAVIGRKPGGKIQKTLSGTERKRNARGRFYLKKGLLPEGKSVLLVDDVATSGATISECAKVLYEGGAKEVIGVVVAVSGLDSSDKPKRYSVQIKSKR